jgi:hypothetical protein
MEYSTSGNLKVNRVASATLENFVLTQFIRGISLKVFTFVTQQLSSRVLDWAVRSNSFLLEIFLDVYKWQYRLYLYRVLCNTTSHTKHNKISRTCGLYKAKTQNCSTEEVTPRATWKVQLSLLSSWWQPLCSYWVSKKNYSCYGRKIHYVLFLLFK